MPLRHHMNLRSRHELADRGALTEARGEDHNDARTPFSASLSVKLN